MPTAPCVEHALKVQAKFHGLWPTLQDLLKVAWDVAWEIEVEPRLLRFIIQQIEALPALPRLQPRQETLVMEHHVSSSHSPAAKDFLLQSMIHSAHVQRDLW